MGRLVCVLAPRFCAWIDAMGCKGGCNGRNGLQKCLCLYVFAPDPTRGCTAAWNSDLRMSPLCVGLLGYRIMVIFTARGRSSIPGSQPDMGLLTGMLWGLALCMASTLGIGNMASEHDGDGWT